MHKLQILRWTLAILISISKVLPLMKKEFETLKSLHVKALRMHAHLCWHIRIEINICRQAGWLLLRFLVNYSAKSRIHICFNLNSLYKNVPSQAGIEWNGCVEKCSLCLRRVVYWNARRASTHRQLYSPGSGCALYLSIFVKLFFVKSWMERQAISF